MLINYFMLLLLMRIENNLMHTKAKVIRNTMPNYINLVGDSINCKTAKRPVFRERCQGLTIAIYVNYDFFEVEHFMQDVS